MLGQTMLLNGSTYSDIDIFKDTVDPNDKVLGIYQKAYHPLRDGSPEAFAQFYTEQSREKYYEDLMDSKLLSDVSLHGFCE
jgi:hypothetical protein